MPWQGMSGMLNEWSDPIAAWKEKSIDDSGSCGSDFESTKRYTKQSRKCTTKSQCSSELGFLLCLTKKKDRFICMVQFDDIRRKKVQEFSSTSCSASSSNSASSSAVASWYCWYSDTRSFMFDSASVNSISSIPSPVYQCKKAFLLNIAVNCSEIRLNNSWMAVLFPMKVADILRPRGGMYKPEASCDTGHCERYEMVEVTVCGCGELERSEADIVECLVVNAVGLVGVLDELVHGEGGVVGLDDGV
ncbi:hypothetical protein TSAR_000624 [Trichomalopsis sarcophagae]|uniref:Uncharacterized protein n=1 Tax=Trichomalopsis sarcophagae TaxID=543379 RepID=A0A232EW50_9HYME|nr:hypothetical protein TSAR_000624 [Trichomalopsis sarcophagae]